MKSILTASALELDLGSLLRFYQWETRYRPSLRRTDPIERLRKELSRRMKATEVIGGESLDDPSKETQTLVRRIVGTIALGIFIVMGLGSYANAQFDELIPTRIGLVKFSGVPPVGRLYKLVSKPSVPPFQLPTVSPATTGGSLTVTMGTGTLSCTLAPGLFAGTAGWKELGSPAGSKGYKYINKLAPAGDPCKIVIVKEKVIKVLAKATGTLPTPVALGNLDVVTVLTLGADDYCALWAQPYFNEKQDRLIKAKNQPSPGQCTSPGDDPYTPEYLADLTTIAARVAAHGFPRLGLQSQVSWEGDDGNGWLGQEHFARMHWYDYAVVDGDAVTNQALTIFLGREGPIRAANPDFVATAYFSPADFVDANIRWRELMRTYAWGPTYDYVTDTDSDPTDGFDQDAWLFHTTTGDPVLLYQFGPDDWSKLQNPGEAGMRSHFVETYRQIVTTHEKVDGIYHDWAVATAPNLGHPSRLDIDLDGDGVSDVVDLDDLGDPVNVVWREGLYQLYDLGVARYPTGFLMTGNLGWYSAPVFTQQLQGIMLEGFNHAAATSFFGWDTSMHAYASYMMEGLEPRVSIVQATLNIPGSVLPVTLLHDVMAAAGNLWFSASDLREMRFTLASTLMFDGHFTASNTNATGGYIACFWLDELSVDRSTGASVFPADASGAPALAHKGWLGQPLGSAYATDDPTTLLWDELRLGRDNPAADRAWRRDFVHGTVLVNPSAAPVVVPLGATHRRIAGMLDPVVNDGSVVDTVTLPATDGLLLAGGS